VVPQGMKPVSHRVREVGHACAPPFSGQPRVLGYPNCESGLEQPSSSLRPALSVRATPGVYMREDCCRLAVPTIASRYGTSPETLGSSPFPRPPKQSDPKDDSQSDSQSNRLRTRAWPISGFRLIIGGRGSR
jgi:hypothetical protein